MSNVIYRDLIKDDYDSIKKLIGEAFYINDFINDKSLLDLVLNIYLQGCILESSYSKVAQKDGKVIGIILGNAKNDKNNLRKFHNSFSFLSSIIKVSFTSKENKKLIKEFSNLQNCYKDLIKGKKSEFDGCVELFIVSKESRGLGVGKTLMNSLYKYMINMNVKSMYLYTDSNCNYKFYDSQNFKRLCEKEIYFDLLNMNLDVFLYGYDF